MDAFDTATDAIIECVKAAGGSKAVGHKLWPEKTVDAAQRHLPACLNDSKAERLTPDQVLLVAQLARAVGCHAYANYCARRLSYAEPQPIEPRDELADLLRQSIEARRESQQRDERIERLLEAIEKKPGTESQAALRRAA